MTRLPLILTALFVVSQALAAPGFYKWVDENGVTTYSQTPPPRQQSQYLTAPPSPETDPEQAMQQLDAQIERLDEVRKSRLEAEKQRDEQRAAQAQKDDACRQAKERLDNFPANPRALIQEPDGSMRRINDDEWGKLREEAEKQVDELCRP